MTARARFSKSDISRAMKAARDAGFWVSGARIEPDGSITILTGERIAANDRHNPLDRVLHQ